MNLAIYESQVFSTCLVLCYPVLCLFLYIYRPSREVFVNISCWFVGSLEVDVMS